MKAIAGGLVLCVGSYLLLAALSSQAGDRGIGIMTSLVLIAAGLVGYAVGLKERPL